MKVKVISRSKKKPKAMIVIHHNNRSYTRHCKGSGDMLQGHALDEDIWSLTVLLAQSEKLDSGLRFYKVTGIPKFEANFLFTYKEGGVNINRYFKWINDQRNEALRLIDKQKEELRKAEQKALKKRQKREKKAS